MQRACWQDEDDVFGEPGPELNFKREKAPWESLSKTSEDLRAEDAAYAQMANVKVKHLWAPPSEHDLEATFERELAAADYEMAPPWDKSASKSMIKEVRDSQLAENYKYEAIWHDSGMSQSRLDQLAAYEMAAPWQRDGGDENKLKDLQEKKVKLPPTLAPWKQGAQPGKSIKSRGNIKPTTLWDNLDPRKKDTKKTLESSGDPIVDALREKILNNPNYIGISSLAKKFKIMDDDRSGSLNFTEFRKGIRECRLDLTEPQLRHLFVTFDKDDSGTIEYEEFLVGLRGQLSERRKYVVGLAFKILDKDDSGAIEMNDIRDTYNASGHREVIAGYKTEDEILRELLDSFDGGEKKASTTRDGVVTLDEFFSYYANISAGIDSDDYFELMIRNAWHIPGGKGWCGNTTNKRVLVTHPDGRQTVEQIDGDLGLKEGDTASMAAMLRKQGIQAASLDTSGGVGNANVAADIQGAELMQPGVSNPGNPEESTPGVEGDSVLQVGVGDQALPIRRAPAARSNPDSRRPSAGSVRSHASAPVTNYADIAVTASSSQVQSLADAVAAPTAAASPAVPALRRRDGAKAPQYTREQMAQAANKGRAATPPVGSTGATATANAGNNGQGKVKSLRETVAKNAAEFLLK